MLFATEQIERDLFLNSKTCTFRWYIQNWSKKLLIIKKFSLKKKHDFFDLFFFLKGFPVCQRPGTFSTGWINVWTLRCGSEINFSLWSLQNGARIIKFPRIHSGFFLSENMNKPRRLLRMKSFQQPFKELYQCERWKFGWFSGIFWKKSTQLNVSEN